MERIFDKTIVFVFCLATLFLLPFETAIVVGMLFALAVTALFEIEAIPYVVRSVLLYAYLAASVFVAGFALFVPLIAYDCFRMKNIVLKLCWIIPLIAISVRIDLPVLFYILVVTAVACGLSWRSSRNQVERTSNQHLRDQLRELSLSLERKNQDLKEKQDYEVKVATLAERGRIAREIHDNVGHLLTRSLLQVEALQVVHADDSEIKAELGQVGDTLHEAFETVRKSVHDLHEESFDLHSQLITLMEETKGLDISVDYHIEAIPEAVGYCFLSIVREALTNTARHSDARHVQVSLVEYPGFYQLVVHDDGGADPLSRNSWYRVDSTESSDVQKLVDRGSGIGLRTMEERTRALGGALRIDYEKGLRIFASIPKEAT